MNLSTISSTSCWLLQDTFGAPLYRLVCLNRVLCLERVPTHASIPSVVKKNGKTNSKTSRDRLPLKINFDCDETLRKYVSGDFIHFVFRCQKNHMPFHVFASFLRSYASSDVTSRNLSKFCFRSLLWCLHDQQIINNIWISDFFSHVLGHRQ